ncbi:MAG TPA: HAMP domain-containing sensor histidine kinase [Polyangia bacterium]
MTAWERDERERLAGTTSVPLAIVARKMRRPIAELDAAIGAIEQQLQADPELVADTRSFFDRSRRNITLLLRMMNDLLALDDTHSAPATFNRKPVDLVSVVARTLLSSPGGLHIRLAARPDGPAFVNCDESRIALVVSNLARNAIDHGTGNAEVSLLPSPAAEATARAKGWTLVFENDGEIAPSLLDKCRAPFFREPGDEHTGLGLGLYLVRHFVEAHHGTFSLGCEGQRVKATVFLPG